MLNWAGEGKRRGTSSWKEEKDKTQQELVKSFFFTKKSASCSAKLKETNGKRNGLRTKVPIFPLWNVLK